MEAAVQITARRQGGAAATVAGQPLETLITHGTMAWAAATALSRGFNLQRQDFDGRNRASTRSDIGRASWQGTCCDTGGCRVGFPLRPSFRLSVRTHLQMMLTPATGRTSGALPTLCWCPGSTC